MIRIDLGKGDAPKTPKANPFKELVEKLKAPPQAKGPGKKKQDLQMALIVGVAVALACIPHFFVSQFASFIQGQHENQMKGIQEKQDSLKSEIARFQSFQREMESFERQKTLIHDRLRIVQQLLDARGTSVNVLDAVGQSLPQKAWLTSFDLKLNPEPKLTMIGQALSNDDISDFVDRLSESIHLGEVGLGNVSTSGSEMLGNDVQVRSFEIDALPRGVAVQSGTERRDTATK